MRRKSLFFPDGHLLLVFHRRLLFVFFSHLRLVSKRYFLVALLGATVLLPSFAKAQFDLSFFEFPPRSPINNAAITLPDSGWSYNFMTTGHLFGAHENRNSIYPAASFLANVDMINGQSPTVFIATGDIVRSAKDSLATQGWRTAGQLLKAPIYNAPGNHDLDDEQAYKKAFGSLQSSFFIRDDLFVLLNSEFLKEGKAEKLNSFIAREAEKATKRVQPVRHLFVFSHRMLAPLCNPDLSALDALANEPFSGKVSPEEACEIFKALKAIPHTGEFWNFSGDVGTHWSVPALYGFDELNECHVLATGVGDTDEDRVAKVTVSYDGKVTAEVLPLFPEGRTQPAEDFTASFWQKSRGVEQVDETTSENWMLAQFRKASFWGGVGSGIVLSLVGFLLLRRFRRNKGW